MGMTMVIDSCSGGHSNRNSALSVPLPNPAQRTEMVRASFWAVKRIKKLSLTYSLTPSVLLRGSLTPAAKGRVRVCS